MTGLPEPTEISAKTSLLVLQATPFCNLDCSYCYLPHRDDRRRMPLEVVRAAVEWVFREAEPTDPLAIVWHAGEPLAVPVSWYDAAFAAISDAAPTSARIRHHIQTNATLVNDRWCDLFRRHKVVVGVSLDGPADLHDLHRRTRRGGGSHAQAMRGVRMLQDRGVPLHAICVVHRATLDAPERLADFFIEAGISYVGLNIEEIEGVNLSSSLAASNVETAYRNFLERLLERAEQHGGLNIREADNFVTKLTHPQFGSGPGGDENTPFAIVTVAHDGQLSTFSPELAGQTHPAHGSLQFGRVQDVSMADIRATPRFAAVAREIAEGVAMCEAECRYFDLCGGGAPSNKLAENGSFASTETLFCRLTQKASVDVMLDRLAARLKTAS